MEQELIQWANQVEPTQSIDDLKSGVALCYLICRELYQDKKLCELKIRVINCHPTDYHSCIRNLSFALQLLEESSCQQLAYQITAQMLYQNPSKCQQILSAIYPKQPKPPKPPKAPKQDELFYVDDHQPTHYQHQEEVVANRYKVIKPQSPYHRSEQSSIHQDDSQYQSQPKQQTKQSSSLPKQSKQHQTSATKQQQTSASKQLQQQKSQQHQSIITIQNQSLQQPDYDITIKPQIHIPNQQQSQQSYPQYLDYPVSVTHDTEFADNSNRSIEQQQVYSAKRKGQYQDKLQHLEQEILNLDSKIQKEQNDLNNMKKSYVSKSFDMAQVQVIPNDQRIPLIDWLKEIRLIRSNAQGLQSKLAKICRNGVIFFDLINRMSGRDEVLKGAIRNPKNDGQIKHNYRRVLEYLKQFPKFNYRYLNAETQLADINNDDAFWGLLSDIKQFYNLNTTEGTRNNSQKHNETIIDQVKPVLVQKVEKSNNIPNKESSQRHHSPGVYSRLHSQKQEYDSVNKSHNSLLKKSQLNSLQGTPVNQSMTQSRQFSSSKPKRRLSTSTSVSKNCVTREMELYVQTYFKQKGLYNNDNLFSDPIRNGQYIIHLINQSSLQCNFRSIMDVEHNIHMSMQAVKAMVDTGTLPVWINSITKQNIMQLDKQAMGLYWWLIKSSTNKPQLTEQISQFVLPYKQEEIDQLKLISLHWARETVPNINIQSFNELILQSQTGVILCHLLAEILQTKLLPIHSNPIGEKQCIANVRKALDQLKSKPIGQRFLWKEDSIIQGDQLVILGLFEDVRRYQDGLPQRQGESYFEEGPYLVKRNKHIQQQPVRISNELFQCKPLSLIDQNQQPQQLQNQHIQVSKRLIFEEQPKPVPGVEWLLQMGYKINWDADILDEFRDGTLLCNLMQRLENIQFRGVQLKPNTNAACLVNIRKVFNILKDKLDMPIELVMDQEKVAQGDREFIIRLLGTIKVIYKHKIKKV